MLENGMTDRSIQLKIFQKLLKHYGSRKWWPARTRFEVIVGAILVQNVSWKNAKTAVRNLQKSGLLSPKVIISAEHNEIADKIKCSRFYNQKAHKLKAFSRFLIEKYDGSLDKMFSSGTESLRKELLGINGIGKETADSILLYAGKKLSFVSDAYTERFLKRYGLLNGMKGYEEIRQFFMDNLPKDVSLYNEYHALIVHHSYAVCKAKPDCQQCALKAIDSKTYCRHALN